MRWLLYLCLLLIAISGASAVKLYVVDNIDDSIINANIWQIQESGGGPCTNGATETSQYLEVRTNDDATGCGFMFTRATANGSWAPNLNDQIQINISRIDLFKFTAGETQVYADIGLVDESGTRMNLTLSDTTHNNLMIRIFPGANVLQYTTNGWLTNTSNSITSLNDAQEWYLYIAAHGRESGSGNPESYVRLYDYAIFNYAEAGNFSVRATNAQTGAPLFAFNATVNGTPYSTTNGIIITGISEAATDAVDITYNAAGFINRTYSISPSTEENTGQLRPAFTITAYDVWSGAKIMNITAVIDSTTYTTDDGTLVTGVPYNGGNKLIFVNSSDSGGYLTNTTTWNVNSTLNISLPQTTITIRAKNNQSNDALSTFNVSIDGFFKETSSGSVTYYLSAGSYNVTVNAQNYASATREYDFSALDTRSILLSLYVIYNITLIDETTALPFDLEGVDQVRLYLDDNSSYYDFLAAGTTSHEVPVSNQTKYRLQLVYPSGDVVQRYIDLAIFPNTPNIRLCANDENSTHYEQLISSSTNKAVKLHNPYADCYVVGDYTRFAYQNSYILRAFTIDAQYNLEYIEGDDSILLGSIDGGLAISINVDVLEFQRDAADIRINTEILTTETYEDSNGDTTNTTIIYYRDYADDNQYINIKIYRMDTGALVFNASDYETPNNQTVYFDSTVLGTSDDTLFKVVVTSGNEDGTTGTLTRYFNKLGSSPLAPQVAFAISVLLFIFGLTLTVSSLNFSWFGIIVTMASIIVASLGGFTWYINLVIAVYVICLAFIVIKMVQGNTTQVT